MDNNEISFMIDAGNENIICVIEVPVEVRRGRTFYMYSIHIIYLAQKLYRLAMFFELSDHFLPAFNW